jgi:hypothetical protein
MTMTGLFCAFLGQIALVLRLQLTLYSTGNLNFSQNRQYDRAAFAVTAAQIPVRRNDDGGRPYVARNASLNRRMLRNPAAKAISDSGIAVWSISRFAACTRRVAAISLGVAPAC